MSNHLIETVAIYRLGNQRLRVKVAFIGRNLNRVEHIPEETPEYADGAVSRVQTSLGEWVNVTMSYDDLVLKLKEVMESFD